MTLLLLFAGAAVEVVPTEPTGTLQETLTGIARGKQPPLTAIARERQPTLKGGGR